jgi:hypothetical protein
MKEETETNVKRWLEDVVIGLNLCPFAKGPFLKKEIRFCVSEAKSNVEAANDIIKECHLLDEDEAIETTLVIYPQTFGDFLNFNDFLFFGDLILKENHWQGVYQIASFHPNYRFANTESDDPQNLTNRSPYPILHLLRESSLTKALDQYTEPEQIPKDNIRTMRELTQTEKQTYFSYLYK